MIPGSLKRLALLAGIPVTLVFIFIIVCAFQLNRQQNMFVNRAPFFQSEATDVQQAAKDFDAQVQEKFYRGMPEEDLIKALTFLEFRVNREKQTAVYSLQVFPCLNTWIVNWTLQDGRMVLINSNYGLTCP
jgi:hypothetical protein